MPKLKDLNFLKTFQVQLRKLWAGKTIFCCWVTGCWENLIMIFFGYWATILDCDSAVLKKVKKISMASNVLPLHFAPSQATAQAKIQMLATSSWIVKILLKSLGLYHQVFLFSPQSMHAYRKRPRGIRESHNGNGIRSCLIFNAARPSCAFSLVRWMFSALVLQKNLYGLSLIFSGFYR